MRNALILATLLPFSSCIAVGYTAVALASIARDEDEREGASKEAKYRADSAKAAAIARARYNESERRDLERKATMPAPPAVVSAPPLIAAEPARTPLRPRR